MVITSLYAGMLGIMLIALSLMVVKSREKFEVGLGDGGHDDLNRAIRVHANFIEYTPIALILLALLELNNSPDILIHTAGAGFFIARFMHAQGLGKTDGASIGRLVGTLASWVIITGLALANIYVAIVAI